MVRPIRYYGDPLLRKKAHAVDEVDLELKVLINDMFETMEAVGGIGLAAPQIGVSLRVFVVDLREGPDTRFVAINPSLQLYGQEISGPEGCLSIPGLYAEVTRPSGAELSAMDLDGKKYRRKADGLLAKAFQHEVDHLDGMFFVDRVSAVRRAIFAGKLRKLERDVIAGRPIEIPSHEKAESRL